VALLPPELYGTRKTIVSIESIFMSVCETPVAHEPDDRTPPALLLARTGSQELSGDHQVEHQLAAPGMRLKFRDPATILR
jgi:hypothetical protein